MAGRVFESDGASSCALPSGLSGRKADSNSFRQYGEWLARGFSDGSVDVLGAEGLQNQGARAARRHLMKNWRLAEASQQSGFGELPGDAGFRSIVTLGSKGGLSGVGLMC